MKCLNCNSSSITALCSNCNTNSIIEKTCDEIIGFSKLNCSNENLLLYMDSFTDYAEKYECIKPLLDNYTGDRREYFLCRYEFKVRPKDKNASTKCVNSAITYIEKNNFKTSDYQNILDDLLNFYSAYKYKDAEKWYIQIHNNSSFASIELLYKTCEFFAQIGEYELSEKLIARLSILCKNQTGRIVSSYATYTGTLDKLDGLKKTIERYKSGKPYWPSTEEKRKEISYYYDLKGIKYGKLKPDTNKRNRVKECNFKKLNLSEDIYEKDYCIVELLCDTGMRVSNIYKILVLKIRNNQKVDIFDTYIGSLDGANATERIFAKYNINNYDINRDDYAVVFPKFLNFINNDMLVVRSTTSKEINALKRIYRYLQIDNIKNDIFSLEDYAYDKNDDLENIEDVLDFYKLTDLQDLKSKANNSFTIFKKMKEL